MDATIKNFAPDADKVIIRIGEWEVIVERDENGEVSIALVDHGEGSETQLTLGQEGETQKV